MSSISIAGDTSGSVILTVPAAAGSSTITLPAGTGTAAVQGVSTNIVSGTVQNTTSGTSIDFTGIPSWVKRISVLFNGFSTSGTSAYLVQLGAGSITTSGYDSGSGYFTGTNNTGYISATNGFAIINANAANSFKGIMTICLQTTNTWVASHSGNEPDSNKAGGGSVTLSGTLDRLRITTANGTDTFDAGTINILYE